MDRLGVKKAVIYASLIGTILSEYEEHERTKQINNILTNLSRFLIITKRKQAGIYFEALEIAKTSWEDSVLHFKNDKKLIESVTLVNDFYDQAREALRRYARVSPEMVNQFSASQGDEIKDSYEVSDYIIGNVYEALGETKKSLGLLKN